MKKPRIHINCKRIEGDPTAYLWYIEVEDDTGSWNEVYGSVEHVEIFLRGLEAGYMMADKTPLEIPAIPRGDYR